MLTITVERGKTFAFGSANPKTEEYYKIAEKLENDIGALYTNESAGRQVR